MTERFPMLDLTSTTPHDLGDDERWMRRALELARLGEGFVEPNPMVGCVIVASGEVIGEGYHQRFGGPHAEIEAITSVVNRDRVRGATAYVTLEPCCHFGKTPPCADALIGAGIKRVVAAMRDPFPKVDGGGLSKLQANCIEVKVGVLQTEAERLNAPYLKRVCDKQPWVIAKWAMTIDGRIATRTGASQWITSDSARRAVHELRGRVDMIAVGMGTVEADDPLLNARPAGPRLATRVVFCRHRLPRLDSKLIRTAHEIPVLLVVGPAIEEAHLAPLVKAGATILRTADSSTSGIHEALHHWGESGITNVMLEGGGQLLGSFHDAGAIDEYHVYIGSKLFGGAEAPGPIAGLGVGQVHESPSLILQSIDRFGSDLRLTYRRIPS